jgi:hypothetical protein
MLLPIDSVRWTFPLSLNKTCWCVTNVWEYKNFKLGNDTENHEII